MAPGDSYDIAGYTFGFEGVQKTQGPNYRADEGVVEVTRDGEAVTTLAAQKRQYDIQMSIMTEAAIDAGFTRDLYVALGEKIGDDGAWSVRLYYKPFIRWIWLGSLLMGLGGVLAVCDRRYRKVSERLAQQTTHQPLEARPS
jgi:cytochrome c-type biogenesis protein CcmF